jgi:hypothetical protein
MNMIGDMNIMVDMTNMMADMNMMEGHVVQRRQA